MSGWNYAHESLEKIDDDKITLRELPRTVVHVKTKEEYNELMEIYERAGWKWQCVEASPTAKDYWGEYNRLCIRCEKRFDYGSKGYFEDMDFVILTLQEFKEHQGLVDSYERDVLSAGCYLTYIDCSFKNVTGLSKKGGLIKMLRDIPKSLKRFLNKEYRALYRLGWVDGDLALNHTGGEKLQIFQFNKEMGNIKKDVSFGEHARKELKRREKEEENK